MNQPITSLAELKAEINRLVIEKERLEIKIQGQVQELYEQVKPANLIRNLFASVSNDTELKNQFAVKGAETILSFIISNIFLRRSSPLIKTIATLAGTTALSQIVGEDASKYLKKAKNFFINLLRKLRKDDRSEPEFNEVDIYKNTE
jgi:hypothetical protein